MFFKAFLKESDKGSSKEHPVKFGSKSFFSFKRVELFELKVYTHTRARARTHTHMTDTMPYENGPAGHCPVELITVTVMIMVGHVECTLQPFSGKIWKDH